MIHHVERGKSLYTKVSTNLNFFSDFFGFSDFKLSRGLGFPL